MGERKRFTAEGASAREEDIVRSSHEGLKGGGGQGATYARVKRKG